MRGRKRTNKVTLWLNRVQSLEADLSGFSLGPSPSNQLGKRPSELLEDVRELKNTITRFTDDNEMTEELMSPNRDVWLLRKEMCELIASRDGLLRKVIKLEEMHGQERTNQVVSWLETVRSLEEEYDNLEVDLSNICTCHGSCYLNCSPSNELGKRAVVLLDEVRATNTERSELTKLVEAIPGPISLETDSPLKEALEQLRRFCFKTDEASVIGVCGMGGIGKTTLMERFEAELLHRPGDFKKIIFVVVSKEPNAQKMQKEIGMVLGLHIQDGENIERHANQILKILQDMRYALLMDDVWNGSILKKILKDIGIPLPNMINKSKLIVTTRTEKVCNQMGTGDYKVRISCLKSEEAWALFKKSVGELIINSDPDINVHAKAMAKKCGGLPLALTVIGSAMANKKTIQEWEHAASSMEELRTDKIEEDYKIMKEELVDKWIGEGFFDGEYNDDIDKARGEGHSIIGILKIAHLLETGHSRDFDVRMHDVIRDMALWISSKKKGNKFLVRAGIGLTEAPESRKWSGNKRISLMDNNIKDLSCLIPDCPNLSTLFLQNNYYLSGNVTSVFFQSMTNLRILDLSRTDIKSLPIELGRLSGLRNLNLEGTGRLESIPKGAILTLGKLKLLNLRYSNYFIGDGSANVENSFCDTEVSIQDLDALKSLQEVALDLKSIDVYRQFISLTKLPRITSALVLSNSNSWGTLHLSSTLSKMDRLISLEFIYCEGLNEMIISGGENGPLLPKLRILELDSLLDLRMIKVEAHVALQNIRKLRIVHCTLLKHVEWIRNLRCLEKIHISYCDGMKKLIGGEDGVMEDNATTLTLSLPKLRSIVLGFLPKLESICKHPLLFSSLKHLIVSKCPHMKKLPLQINSAPNLKEIECEQEWWDGLVWDDELIKQKFVGSFKAMIPREFG
ncbi:putative disease resistance protein [Acorus calamus]|uniref:Disease resistance protein n=1 Tax=Acorus calamus TaxID=4465 RepID=A0AAV9EHZ8_ACOCL|nr:putative disease resistance protein [Acorus calamus]